MAGCNITSCDTLDLAAEGVSKFEPRAAPWERGGRVSQNPV